jgi:hypothetical protein
MIALILALVSTTSQVEPPSVTVEVGAPEAIFVPAGWTGPVVAAPFDEPVFEVIGE